MNVTLYQVRTPLGTVLKEFTVRQYAVNYIANRGLHTASIVKVSYETMDEEN